MFNSRYAVSEENLVEVIADWTTAEHARLHGPGNSALSDLEAMRAAAALPYDHYANTPVKKTTQHIVRLRQRLLSLEEAEFETQYTGRAISDCFKLFAGQQIKRLVAVATDQDDFAERVRSQDLGVSFTIDALLEGDVADQVALGTLPEEVDLLSARLHGSLSTISDRAAGGDDWGLEKSKMVEAAWLGEVACARMSLVAIMMVASHGDGIENVPLRMAANDQEDAPIIFPFRAD